MVREGKTHSDIESDEEFAEITSDELSSFYFKDNRVFLDALKLELSKKRLDRIDKMLRVPMLRVFSMSDAVFTIVIEAFKWMPMVECLEVLRITYDRSRIVVQRATQKFMVKQAMLFEDDNSLDKLRELLGTLFVNQVVEEEQKWLRPRSELLSASLRGDLAEVQRLLAAGKGTWLDETFRVNAYLDLQLDAITAAAELGHSTIVNTLLASSIKLARLLVLGYKDHEGVWSIACRRSDLAMASSMLSVIDITRCCLRQVAECLKGTPEFFRRVLLLIRARFDEAGRKIKPEWLTNMLNYAIKQRKRHHVAILLNEIDQDRSAFDEYPWKMQTILHSRSAAILRDVLIRYPEAPAKIADCDPLLAIQDYHWPAGAHLLLEAGAKIQGTIPPNFVEFLSLSLEERSRSVARKHVKVPLSRNVDRLPLPTKVKRQFLYKRSETLSNELS